MNFKKNVLVLIIIIINCINLAGCKDKEPTKVVQEMDKEPYLNVLLGGEPKSLDPSKADDTYSYQILGEVNEALTRLEKDSNGKDIVKPAGAEKWEVSLDGLKWTFHLRDNKWSDGKSVTAYDYEYGIKRSLDPKISSKNTLLLYPIKGARDCNNKNKANSVSSDLVGVKAIDNKTLEINLESPCAYFLNLTYFRVMQPQRKDIVEKFKDKYGTNSDTMIFSGPFIIKQWVHNNRIELVKNDNYWDSKSVKLKKATFRIMSDDASKLNDLMNGALDSAVVNRADWKEKLDKTDKFNVITTSQPSINFDFFNEKSKLFSNTKIRKAFVLAINREDISKNIWKSIYTPAYGWVPPSIHIGSDSFREKAQCEPIKKLKEDNLNPKKLLLEGLAEIGLEQDPSKYTVNYLQPTNDVRQKEIAEFFQDMYYKNLGINVRLQYVNSDEFKQKIDKGEYDMASSAWSSDYDDPISSFDIFVSSVNLLSTSWSDSKYDKLIKEAYSKPFDKNNERFENFKAAEYILLNEYAVISPTVYRNKQIYNHKYVKGVINTVFGSDLEIKYAYTERRGK